MRALALLPLLLGLILAGCGSPSSASSNPTSTPVIAAGAAPGGLNHVHSIVIMPNDPQDLYLGTHYRLLKTTDGGMRWQTLSSQMMLSMAMVPNLPSTIYAVSSQHGLQVTSDGGKHWSAPAAKLPGSQVVGVAYDAPAHAVLAYGNGLYRSVDGGAHWTHLLGHTSVENIAVAPDGTVYAATSVGVDISRDGAMHWKMAGSIGNQPIIQVAAAGRTAYAVSPVGVFKSANDGRSWQLLNGTPTGIEFVGVAPSDPNELFAEIGGRGFIASYDGGKVWRSANQGIKDRNFNASTVRVAPSSPNVVYTGAWGLHFYVSHDAGRHWTQVAVLKH